MLKPKPPSNKALQATPVNVAVFRADFMLVVLAKRGTRAWGAPELGRSASFPTKFAAQIIDEQQPSLARFELRSFVIMKWSNEEVGMASQTGQTQTYEAVIKTVRGWSAAQRLSLIQDVLATFASDVAPAPKRQPTLARALGLLATNRAVPSDSDIAALLDERRRERYGL